MHEHTPLLGILVAFRQCRALKVLLLILVLAAADTGTGQSREPFGLPVPGKKKEPEPTPGKPKLPRSRIPGKAPSSPSVGRIVRDRYPEPATVRGITWENWWFHNKDRYLAVHQRFALSSWISGPGGTVDLGAEKRSLRDKVEAFLRRRREKLLPFLLKAAANRDRQLSISALFALGHLKDSEAVKPLLDRVGDPDRTVREMVVLALGMIGDSRARPTLEAILNGGERGKKRVGLSRIPHRLRGLAALSLGLLKNEQKTHDLLSMAVRRRKLPDVIRMGAVVALGLIGAEKTVPELAALALHGKESPSLRCLAVTALGRTGLTSALNYLARALEAKHPDVQAAAVLAVAAFPYETPEGNQLREAVNKFQRDKAEKRLTPREESAQGRFLNQEMLRIEKLEGPRKKMRGLFRTLIRRRVEKYRGPRERGLAALALGSLGTVKDAGILVRLLSRGSLEVKGFSALGLGILARRGDPNGRIARNLALMFAAEKRNPRLRGALALALGMTGDPLAGTFLLEAVQKTSDPVSQAYLIQGLGMLRHRPAYPVARDTVVAARDNWVLQNTVQGFALLADPTTGMKMIPRFQRTRNQPERIALGAALAFSALGLKETLEPLLHYMDSRKNPVLSRAFVAEAVGLAGNLESLPPLSRIAAGHNFSVATPPVDLVIRLRW